MTINRNRPIRAMPDTYDWPPDLHYTIYASVTEPGMPTVWEASACRQDEAFATVATANSPLAALIALAKML